MTYRRRHRWLRRLAFGLAFATFAAPAAAKLDEVGDGNRYVYVTAGGWSGYVDSQTGVPLSAGIPQGDEQPIGDQATQVTQYLSPSVRGEAVKTRQAVVATRPDDRADRFTGIEQPQVISARPDDKADRFAHSDVASSSEPASSGPSVDWDGAMTLGIGAVVLALALGLGLGFLKRPRIAGL